MRHQVEVTDTFGGEANYSWVRRYTLDNTESLTDLQLVRRAKAISGYNGVPAKTSSMGDIIEIRPRGMCVVIFVSYIEDSQS